jgi:dipeptidyl aminopeptidase/acylaminoacyl peptidase
MVELRSACLIALTFILTRGATAAISSTMLVEMRDITSVSVSPDRDLVVAGICHPDPRANHRELSWALVRMRGSGTPVIVPGGEEVYDPSAPGALLNRRVLWSKNGGWFYYLRRDGEEVRLWETRRDGKVSRPVTESESDIVDLQASTDPNQFMVQLAPARAALRKAEEDENREGILYDDHILGGFPLTKTFPVVDRWRNIRRTDKGEWVPPGWTGRVPAAFDVRLRKLKISVGDSANELAPIAAGSYSDRVVVVALSPPSKIGPRYYAGRFTLQLERSAGEKTELRCELSECIANQVTVLGWSRSRTEIYYVTDSSQGRTGDLPPGISTIYAWNPDRNAVRLIYDAGGRLYNLDGPAGLSLEPGSLGKELVVAFAGADQPPRLEAINLQSGASRVLFDPNPQLRSLTQGRAAWHTWGNSSGYSGHGFVILPDKYRAGEKYPMVITTYTCGGGFLRGGGADGAPEFVLANHGFVAVCVDVPVFEVAERDTDRSVIYPIVCDILRGLIDDQAQNGALDPNRVGLTGQSLGANAGAYCISHSHAYAAAAFRHGSVIERAQWDLFDTAAWRRDPVNGIYAHLHMPDPRNDPTGRWDKMSVARRARDIDTPTLLQTNDTEYLFSLPLYSAMLEERKPIEMHVFPGETHALIQPVHRLVNYERQVDWFRFWLQHEEDSKPSKHSQYERWNRLRALTANAQR